MTTGQAVAVTLVFLKLRQAKYPAQDQLIRSRTVAEAQAA